MEQPSSPPTWRSSAVAEWERRGRYRKLAGFDVFTLDVPAADAADAGDAGDAADAAPEPLLVIHGFPTCSFDYRQILPSLARSRRVLLLDLPGYGLSAKPDQPYALAQQADVVAAFLAEAGVDRLALLTHDMGDTVGGELLARQLDGTWPVEVTRRVITNGSIYIEMAHLTAGQQFLLSLPDERLPDGSGVDEPTLTASLAATFSATSTVPEDELPAQWELMARHAGQLVLPRTIRYIEERRQRQDRYTGAIEAHPSPLCIVWGAEDPIALVGMAHRLAEARAASGFAADRLHVLEGVGHYPMVEAPDAVVAAIGDFL